VVAICVPFLLAIFAVSSRIGTETRQGLLEILRQNYGRKVSVPAALIIITINMAVVIADLMAVSEMFSVILNQPRMMFVAAIAFSVWYILIFHDYRKITRALVWLSMPLYLYVASAVVVSPGLRQLLHGAVVHASFHPNYIENVVALFGSMLTPYIVLWQTSSRTDRLHEPSQTDSVLATVITAVLACSIIVAAGSVLHFSQSVDLTVRQAADALRPVVGNWGMLVFAVGIIGSGMVALPVLVASQCYDLAQAAGWRYGLSEQPWEAKRFYILISAAMVVATLADFVHMNPVKALYWSMILAGLLLVPMLLFIMIVSNDRRIMRSSNTRWQNVWLGGATACTAAASVIYILQEFVFKR
jgi:Mn2+/Fe2+ NRAMP family transporter